MAFGNQCGIGRFGVVGGLVVSSICTGEEED